MEVAMPEDHGGRLNHIRAGQLDSETAQTRVAPATVSAPHHHGHSETGIYVFFFSSRRRHTSFSRDWSSDVCSSDLLREARDLFAFLPLDVQWTLKNPV